MKTYHIVFEYADVYSGWQMKAQNCTLVARDKRDAINKCKELYGLGVDCEYRIVAVTEVE